MDYSLTKAVLREGRPDEGAHLVVDIVNAPGVTHVDRHSPDAAVLLTVHFRAWERMVREVIIQHAERIRVDMASEPPLDKPPDS